MSVKGIDCAVKLNAATAAAMKAAGYAFAGRYLVPNSGSLAWKALTREEARAITGAGLRILAVWETTANRARQGAAAGASDGARAAELARSMDMPASGVIYFAVDYEAGPGDFEAIAAYLRAARANTGAYEVGVYGSYAVVEAMAQRGACRGFWQTSAWSYGRKSGRLNVYQYAYEKNVGGASVDINECADMDAAGIWGPGTDKPAAPPVTEVSGAYTVATRSDPLNCRDTPGGAVVGAFDRGEAVTAAYECGGWMYVTNGTLSGWVSGKYLAEAIENDKGDGDMLDVSKMSGQECYEVVLKAQEYAANLPASGWAAEKFAAAKERGITDGTRPRALLTREEGAIMADRAAGGKKI